MCCYNYFEYAGIYMFVVKALRWRRWFSKTSLRLTREHEKDKNTYSGPSLYTPLFPKHLGYMTRHFCLTV